MRVEERLVRASVNRVNAEEEEEVRVDRATFTLQCSTANLRTANFLRCLHSPCSLSISAKSLVHWGRGPVVEGGGEEVDGGEEGDGDGLVEGEEGALA
jgi:hypothetical protein